jgi:hypothetical protein
MLPPKFAVEISGVTPPSAWKAFLRRSLRHDPTRFTHLLPMVYACLTPSNWRGCRLSVDLGEVQSFLTSSGVCGLATGRSPSCLLLGLRCRPLLERRSFS